LVRKFDVQHRDIKLGNILVVKEGHYALADFSISKIKDGNLTMVNKIV
jgi:serine/threonine protein kinase